MTSLSRRSKRTLSAKLTDPPDGEVRKKRAARTQGPKSPKKPKAKANACMLEEAKIIVGIDFGTTFSGFAYAAKDDPGKFFAFYDWPCQAPAGVKPYCKTQTSLWYLPGKSTGTFEVQDWGWTGHVNHKKALQAKNSYSKGTITNLCSLAGRSVPLPTCGHFLTKFKLQLHDIGSNSGPQSKGEELPDGFSADRVISDYLRQLSAFVMVELKNKFGSFTQKRDVKWCLTVPTIWTEAAKQIMRNCSEMAGLVRGRYCTDEDASLHPIDIVLEPEAASLYCQQKLKHIHFGKGSKFLVVDAGGGTVDLVVHEKVNESGSRIKEAALSTGDLCGGTFVDAAFMDYLAQKIDCFEKISAEYPATTLTIKGNWENFKCSFDGQQDSYDLDLPAKLADAWEAHQKGNGTWTVYSHYDELVITREDMQRIFDRVVNQILKLIKDQLAGVPEIEAIMVVGGFSSSPYLMKRIREKFEARVKHIVSPTDPGSAVCQGAVAFGALGADIMMSRKSRKIYGVGTSRPFQKGDPPGSMFFDDNGEALCQDHFYVFTKIGDDVPVDHTVLFPFVPVNKGEASMGFTMYSTSDPAPAFVTDTGVETVGSWTCPFPPKAQRMKDKPSVDIAMYFGRTHIAVSAQPKNFMGGKKAVLSVLFERDLL